MTTNPRTLLKKDIITNSKIIYQMTKDDYDIDKILDKSRELVDRINSYKNDSESLICQKWKYIKIKDTWYHLRTSFEFDPYRDSYTFITDRTDTTDNSTGTNPAETEEEVTVQDK